MARAWFRGLVLRRWSRPVLLPVFRRRHHAAVPIRDRPRDRPMARALFPMSSSTCSSSSAPTLAPSGAPFSDPTATPSCSPSSGPQSYCPSLVPNDVPSAAPTCSSSSVPTLMSFCAHFSFSTPTSSCIPSSGPTAGPSYDQDWFQVLCPRRPRLVLRPVLRPWFPSVLLSVFRRRHQAAYPVRDRPRDRPMARAWFQVPCLRRPRLILRPVLRPWFPSVLPPVFRQRHQAAVPARDRPGDSPMARAWFQVLCPRRSRLVLRPAFRPWRPSELLPVIPR
jgi:hypothetical protein